MHTLDLHQHHHTLSPQGQSQQKRPPTVEERRMWRGSQYWLVGAGAAVGAYVLFSGHYVDLSVLDVDEEAEGECVIQGCVLPLARDCTYWYCSAAATFSAVRMLNSRTSCCLGTVPGANTSSCNGLKTGDEEDAEPQVLSGC